MRPSRFWREPSGCVNHLTAPTPGQPTLCPTLQESSDWRSPCAKGTYLVARGYRNPKSKLFLQTGAGIASFEVNDGEVKFRTRSPSLTLTGGYDWRVDQITITPAITAVGSTGGRLKSDKTGNSIADDARLGLLRATVSLSWFR